MGGLDYTEWFRIFIIFLNASQTTTERKEVRREGCRGRDDE